MAEVSYTYTEIGMEFAIGTTWNGAVVSNLTAGTVPAIIGGLMYAVPAPNELLFRSIVLTITPMVLTLPGTGTLTVSMCTDLDLQPFSDTNLPSTQNTIQIYQVAQTLVADTTITIPFDLGVNPLQTDGFVGSMETVAQYLGHSDFQGVIGLVIEFDGAFVSFHGPLAPGSAALNPTFTIDQEPFLTGLSSSKTRSSRADFCPRCGTPMFREQFIKDGQTGTLVCSDCYDPPTRRRRLWKPPKEINP